METTPENIRGVALQRDLETVKCNLWDGDEFTWTSTGPSSEDNALPTPSAGDFDVDLQDPEFEWLVDPAFASDPAVTPCICHATPPLPRAFTPCCIPFGALTAKREIQMKACFRDNLLGQRGAPLKTQTLRVWSAPRASEHYRSFLGRKWIRVWRGQGHIDTIGWMQIQRWDTVRLGDITEADCEREGRPDMEPLAFLTEFLLSSEKNINIDTVAFRLLFRFRPCKTITYLYTCS